MSVVLDMYKSASSQERDMWIKPIEKCSTCAHSVMVHVISGTSLIHVSHQKYVVMPYRKYELYECMCL